MKKIMSKQTLFGVIIGFVVTATVAIALSSVGTSKLHLETDYQIALTEIYLIESGAEIGLYSIEREKKHLDETATEIDIEWFADAVELMPELKIDAERFNEQPSIRNLKRVYTAADALADEYKQRLVISSLGKALHKEWIDE
jgi:hypothetical protein